MGGRLEDRREEKGREKGGRERSKRERKAGVGGRDGRVYIVSESATRDMQKLCW